MNDEVKLYSSSTLVSAATVLTGATLISGGNDSMVVSSGGTANSTTVNSHGQLYVSSGGTANSSIISAGTIFISNGGIGNNTIVYAYQYYEWGTYTMVTRYIAGSAFILSGGMANNTVVNNACVLHISSGGTANSTTVNSGSLYVSSGGTANDTTVNSGSLYVSSGGTANDTTMSGGYLCVSSGGTANSTTMSGGNMYVSSGGTANSTTILNAGYLHVSSGGTALKIKENGGYVAIDSGADVTFVANSFSGLSLSAKATLHSGTTATNTLVSAGGYLYVLSGGTALEIKENGGYVDVDSNANVTFAAHCFSGVTVNESESATLHSGTTATDVEIHGGDLFVSSGGIANNTKITGAVVGMYGSRIACMWVSSGGTANSTTVHARCSLSICSGAMVNYTTINSGASVNIISGVSVTGTTICGGSLYVSSGGTANSTTVSSGGCLSICSGAVVNYTTVNTGACVNIISGVTVNDTTMSGGSLAVSSGGTAAGTILTEGYLFINSGGFASSTTITNGWLHVFSGGTAEEISVEKGAGYIKLSSGGIARKISVQSEAVLTLSGGKYSDVRLLSCATVKLTGGNGDESGSGTGYPGVAGEIESATIDDGGILSAYYNTKYDAPNNAIVRSAAVHSGGSVIIDANCSAVQNILSTGGAMTIRDQAQAEDTQVTGGTLYVLQGGKATGSEISGKGKLMLSGKALDTTVSTDGALFVGFNAIAENLTVNGGGVYVMGGGEIKGDISISQSGGLYLYGGSIVEGDIHVKGTLYVDETMVNNGKITLNLAKGENVMIQNLDYLLGTDILTVETGDVGDGVYTLADGAAEFDGMIAVMNKGSELGTLAIGETKNFDGVNYSLARNDDELEIRLGAVVRITAKSDIDDSGISDVMFQYTGGDYQIGFWMNGTNTWQGQGISQPSNWELLGAYDMDQNGKADIVMRGNIQIGTDKGAYIGYYKDGDVTQWQNISFLNNPDDIDWRLAIGNVTGNEGCNSIVWHAPELGALGVWTNGTSNWVSLAGGFDSNWTMLGCGDFDGNGKDEVLFSNSGNLYTTDIDQNFASLGGWGNDWEVKTIGDFSGDGKDDIILQNGNMVVKFENGLAENWSSVGGIDASDWFIVGAGDYNGDGADDLLVRQSSTGMLGYYESGDMSKWVELGRGVDMNWTVIA